MSGEFPLPDLDWEPTRPFWQGAARGELVIPHCDACGRYCWYPPERCPGCKGELEWSRVSGRGTLFSWAVVQRPLDEAYAAHVPFTTGLVALEEAPEVRLVTNVVDCEAGALRIDLPVHVVFRPLIFSDEADPVVAPLFAPST